MTHTGKTDNTNWYILFVCWLTVSVSTLGSLFFSEILEYPPCVLCWYQRIFMFPLVFILLAGLFPFDRTIFRYAFPLALAGWVTALYHTLLYSGFISDSMQPCSQGVSCTETYIDFLGFITIPLLSLISFSLIIGMLLFLRRRLSK
jgi:disulfide bond formation protein DsbB